MFNNNDNYLQEIKKNVYMCARVTSSEKKNL